MPPYPDWAQAVVPPYPNLKSRYIVKKDTDFELESADSFDSIVAWYKSHVSGTWTTDATSGNVSTTANGLKINIVKDQLDNPPITMIELSKG